MLKHTRYTNILERCPAGGIFDDSVKIVFIYFSMSHCPPCRLFTPVFIDLYEEINDDIKIFEVIFASCDISQENFDSYYEKMPWLSYEFKDSRINQFAY